MARRVITKKNKAIEWSGLREIEANVNRLLEELGGRNGRGVGKEVKRVFMGAALVVRDEMRDLVRRKTGLLGDAIFAAYGDESKPDVLVGVNHRRAPHSHLIEYGTVHRKAFPFFRPAITFTRGKAIAIVAEGLQKLIDKVLR